jgi:crotonobetainyl-CoA:carnitine CoA-transferase CaiB-like acyl-CoA transferase
VSCRSCRSHRSASGGGAPAVGEDTSEILSKLLGLPDSDIEQLYEANVVHHTEPFTTAQVEPVNA